MAIDFTIIEKNQYLNQFFELLNFESPRYFVLSFGLFLVFFYSTRGLVNLIYIYSLNHFTHRKFHTIATQLFEKYMNLPYKNFVQNNSSQFTKTITIEIAHLTSLIKSILLMISEFFVTLLLYILMFYVNYKVTLILTIVFIINGLFLVKAISKKIKKLGVTRASMQTVFHEVMNRSFGNFKFIKLSDYGKKAHQDFSESSLSYANSIIKSETLQQFPRLFLEALAFGIICLIITYIVWEDEDHIASFLSVIALFVLSLYRLMPSLNRIISSYNIAVFYYKSLDITHAAMLHENEKLGNEKITFQHHITLNNVSFEYIENKPIFNDVNLQINKGEKVAFIGESGGGKSTLVDLIMGLHTPNQGNISIDNIPLCQDNIKSWRHQIGYIPQNIYLFDGTVADNIVFGRDYDEKKLINALEKANIYDFLQTQNGISTQVGEGGIVLSGGQKQRVAIARALYDNPETLVLDEATSALDSETEEKIMDEIYKLYQDKTLIVIAHRISTTKRCDKTYVLKKGRLILSQ